jgi:activator of HSP90 ATPase
MSVTITALTVLAQNGLTVTDFTAIVTEYMIDDTINTVNLLFGQSIEAMSGTAGTKDVDMTRNQSAVVKMLLSLVLRENKKTQLTNSDNTSSSTSTSSSFTVGQISQSESNSVSTAISAASAINNPANSVYVNLFMDAGAMLRTVSGSKIAFRLGIGT